MSEQSALERSNRQRDRCRQVARHGRTLGFVVIGTLSASGCSAATQETPGVCTVSDRPLPSSDATITLDVSRKFQTIEGFGTSQRLFDDPHLTNTLNPGSQRSAVVISSAQQAAILRDLYTDLGLTRLRYATDPNIEPLNDNADPAVTDLTKFNFAWKGGDGYISLVNAARQYGLRQWWGSPIAAGEPWMSSGDVAEYVEWALAIIRHWNTAGTPLTYWSIFNEPESFQGITTRSGEFIRDAIKAIGPVLVTEGIPTKLVIPDDVTPGDALNRTTTILADPAARKYVAAVAFHLYPSTTQPNTGSLAALAALAAQYNLPLWMSEWYTSDWFTWAQTMHRMLGEFNVTAVDYLWGFFGQYDIAQLLVIQSAGNTYTGFSRRKQYWAMSQYSSYVRPGAVRIAADTPDPNLRVTAYADGGKVVVVALNLGPSELAVRVELGSGAPCVRSLTGSRTSSSESGRILPEVSLDAPRFVTNLPPLSITTLVAQ